MVIFFDTVSAFVEFVENDFIDWIFMVEFVNPWVIMEFGFGSW
jgi:hypothetical protein